MFFIIIAKEKRSPSVFRNWLGEMFGDYKEGRVRIKRSTFVTLCEKGLATALFC